MSPATLESARKLVAFRADAMIQARVDELARKSNEGTLSLAEWAEYEAFVEVADQIAQLQAKARAVLANADA